MVFKVGDRVKVVETPATYLLEAFGLIKIGGIGIVIENNNPQESGNYSYIEFEDGGQFVPDEWLEFVCDEKGNYPNGGKGLPYNFEWYTNDEIEVDVNNGATVKIQFDGDSLDIDCDATMDDLSDKEVETLYNVVQTLYDLLGV